MHTAHLAEPDEVRLYLQRCGRGHGRPERQVLLDILGICSVVQSPEHTGYLDRWIPAAERVLPELRYVERAYPVCWWRAEYGVNRSAARELRLL